MILLDSNAVIALINDLPATARQHRVAATVAGEVVATSAVVTFELWYGVQHSHRRTENQAALERFLTACLVVPFDSEDAHTAGELREYLESQGQPIGGYDLLIAAQALRRDAVLVTANRREFSRIRGLRLEDWTRPARSV